MTRALPKQAAPFVSSKFAMSPFWHKTDIECLSLDVRFRGVIAVVSSSHFMSTRPGAKTRGACHRAALCADPVALFPGKDDLRVMGHSTRRHIECNVRSRSIIRRVSPLDKTRRDCKTSSCNKRRRKPWISIVDNWRCPYSRWDFLV